MPVRTKAQKIGSQGEQLAKLEIEQSNMWIARNQDNDFGVDIEMEFAPGDVSGKLIKAQIKSHEVVSSTNDFISERLAKSFLRYVNECRIPVVLIVVSVSTKECWYIWLQKWLYDTKNKHNIYEEAASATLEIKIHNHSYLSKDLSGELIGIATWQNETQKLITLHDLAKLSLSLYDDKLADVLFGYIENLRDEQGIEYPDAIIDRVIELGTAIWATSEGNKRAFQLFDFIRTNGDKFTKRHVAKLVLRGNSHSRTGINALSILYDKFPHHTLNMKLPEHFKGINDGLYYYCTLRERNISINGYFWITSVKDFRIDDFTIDHPDFLIEIPNDLANRGDSAILDYVVHKPISAC